MTNCGSFPYKGGVVDPVYIGVPGQPATNTKCDKSLTTVAVQWQRFDYPGIFRIVRHSVCGLHSMM